MKKLHRLHFFGKTTLIKKLLAFYLVIVASTFYFMIAVGRNYVVDQVREETAVSLQGAAERLIKSSLNSKSYTTEDILALRPEFEIAAESSNCQILVIDVLGEVILDTGRSPSDTDFNVIKTRNNRFLHESVSYDNSIGGYLSTPSLCVNKPLRQSNSFSGYLIFAQSNNIVDSRANFYYGILATVYYIMIGLLLLTYVGIFFFCFVPLKKLRLGCKDFGIRRDNPPIDIHSHDEYGELADTLNVIGAELCKFDEYQRKFLSNISHDFRSPLTSIRGYLQAMQDGVIPPEDQPDTIRILLSETDRLTKLTNEIIELNSFDRDNTFLSVSSFDIHAMIRDTSAALAGLARGRDIVFEHEFTSGDELFVDGDKQKIHQVLFNLMENAVKFSSSNSTVFVRTRIKKNKAFISVRDTGIGIPKDDIERIWDRFYKSDLSRGKDKSGSGLGLSICKEIMAAHKQNIDVVSTEGAGTTFTFTLPVSCPI